MDRERLIKQAEIRRSRVLAPHEVSYRKKKKKRKVNKAEQSVFNVSACQS